jgi:hypothetical protein
MANIAKRWRNEYVAFLARLESITLRHFRTEFHGMTRFFTRTTETGTTETGTAPAPAPAKTETVLA